MRISDWSSDVCSSDLAQSAEVTLTGDLQYGVNWYFERAVTDAGLPSAVGRTTWSTLAGSVLPAAAGGGGGLGWTFLGRNAAAVLRALAEEIGRASCRERVCQYV